METFFLRHGDAVPEGERPLSEQGLKEMKRVARWVKDHELGLSAIYSSPLLRARQTAEVVAEVLGLEVVVDAALDSGASLSGIAKLLDGRSPGDRVMLVGHEPDFSGMVGELIGGGAVEMRKGGLARVESECLKPGCGVLRWLLTPKTMG
ncbi:phosphohistidine phosphatase SixA [bacterium]|nr:phosphohistidine phosphatase SixA [bacterium]